MSATDQVYALTYWCGGVILQHEDYPTHILLPYPCPRCGGELWEKRLYPSDPDSRRLVCPACNEVVRFLCVYHKITDEDGNERIVRYARRGGTRLPKNQLKEIGHRWRPYESLEAAEAAEAQEQEALQGVQEALAAAAQLRSLQQEAQHAG